MQDNTLRSIITSMIGPSILPNIINYENKRRAKEIWKTLMDFFASTEASNRARIYREFHRLTFNASDISEFVTSVRIKIERLHEVGIQIHQDVIACMILEKLPESLENIYQPIPHSGKDVTPNLVLDHLQQ